MIEIEDRGPTVVTTPVSDSGTNAAAAIVLAVIFVALIGYLVYAFSNHEPNTYVERNNTTIQTPAPSPPAGQAPFVLPQAAPSPTVIVTPAPAAPAAPAVVPAAPAPQAPAAESNSNTESSQ